MPNTTIFVYTTAASAVKHACQHGRHALQMDLSTWSPDERNWLAEHVVEGNGACFALPNYNQIDSPRWIDVAPPTAERLRNVVLEGMTEDIRKEAEKVAEKKKHEEEKQKRIQDAIEYLNTCPIQDFTRTRYETIELVRAYLMVGNLYSTDTQEYAIDLVPHRKPEFDAYVAEFEMKKATKEAENEAEDERKKAARLADCEAFTAWLRSIERHEQAERCEAGVLPITEAQDVIREKIIAPYAKLHNLNTFTEYDRMGRNKTVPQTWNCYQWDNIKAAKRTVENIQNFWGLQETKLNIRSVYEYIRDPENEDADEDGDVKGEDTIVAKISVTFHGIPAAMYFHI